MNLMEQSYTTIPEIDGTASSDRAVVGAAGIHSQDLRDAPDGGPPVIARFPDVDAPAGAARRRHSSRSSRAKSALPSRRFLGARLSMGILVALGLILMLAAIGPNMILGIAERFQSGAGDRLEGAWQAPPPAPTADLAPAWKPPMVQLPPALEAGRSVSASAKEVWTAASKPAASPSSRNEIGTLLPPQANKLEIESAGAAQSSPWPRMAGGDADFSPWPNPAHPIVARTQGSGPGINESHTADRRNAPAADLPARTPSLPALQVGGGAGAARSSEGATALPLDGN